MSASTACTTARGHAGQAAISHEHGQNVLNTRSVAHLAGLMASEASADMRIAKAGLLHDIGRRSTTGRGPMCRSARIWRKIPRAARSSMRYKRTTAISRPALEVLVQAADAISAAAGARRETLESYIKRLEKLEEIANSFEGVDNSYAIQAGREVRIVVKPEVLDDNGSVLLARDIAKKIEAELDYPGQIKVNVIRETRATDYNSDLLLPERKPASAFIGRIRGPPN